METYCVSCKNNTGNKNSTVKTTKKTDYSFYQIVLFLARKN